MAFHPTRFDPPARIGMQAFDDPQTLPAPPKVELEIVRGKARHTRRHVVGKVFLIGSACDCDLVLGDEQFPDAYAYLFVQPDGVTVRHLGSGPAVTVDGQPVQARQLQNGELLECGPYAFRVSIRPEQPIDTPRDGERSPPAPHLGAEQLQAREQQATSLVAADDVLGLRVARQEVSQLLSDIAAALDARSEKLKLYRGPESTSSGLSLAERVRRRASA